MTKNTETSEGILARRESKYSENETEGFVTCSR